MILNDPHNNCTFAATMQDRIISLNDFVNKYPTLASQCHHRQHEKIVSVLAERYQLSDEEANQVVALAERDIINDFDMSTQQPALLQYVVFGHDMENIKLMRYNEYNWLHHAVLTLLS